MELSIGLIGLIIFIGSLCGLAAFIQIQGLKAQMNLLKQQVSRLSKDGGDNLDVSFADNQALDAQSQISLESTSHPHATFSDMPLERPDLKTSAPHHPSATTKQLEPTPSILKDFFKEVKNQLEFNWMVWIGGLALAFGGVFFVNYALEAGLLSPTMRVMLGALFGIASICAAQYLHRREVVFERFTNYIPAALAGGGFISLFALTLFSLINYQLISATTAFVLLAFIAVSASWFALRFGPLLAVLGIVASYSVPLWVSSGQSMLLFVLSYIAMVTISATLVASKVKRVWLWYLIWSGQLLWLLVASFVQTDEHFHLAIGIFSVFSIILLIVVPRLTWRLISVSIPNLQFKQLMTLRPDNILLVIVLLCVSIALLGTGDFVSNSLLAISITSLLFLAPQRFNGWDSWLFFGLLILLILIVSQVLPSSDQDGLLAFSGTFLIALAASAIILSYGCYFSFRFPTRLSFSLIAVLSPFCLLASTYVQIADKWLPQVYGLWSTFLLLSAAAMVWASKRHLSTWQRFIWWCGVNANITLAMTMLLDKTGLTLALAIQVFLISILVKRTHVDMPHWPLKVLTFLVTIRLTMAPWQADYQQFELIGMHWTSVIYPLVIALFVMAARCWQSSTLKAWLQGAALHCIALFITTQTSLLLVGNMPDFGHLSLHEHIVLSINWLLLAGAYLYRSKFANKLCQLYQIAAGILIFGSFAYQFELFLEQNPLFEQINIGSMPIFNWLLLWWGAPAILFMVIAHLLTPINTRLKKACHFIAACFAVLSVNALIRQCWQGEYIDLSNATSDGEMISYSLFWLFIACITVIMGHFKTNLMIQKVGLALLAIVIGKVFLVDMANLTGLLRAASFVGLGLSLVGLSGLFQWLRKRNYTVSN